MQHWTSNIHWLTLSSLGAGVALGRVLQDVGTCTAGFLSMHILWLWLRAFGYYCINFVHRCKPDVYTAHNDVFMRASTASAEPRPFVAHEPAVVFLGTLSILLGIADALVAVLPSTPSDSIVLAIYAVLVSKGKLRALAMLVLVLTVCTQPLPAAPHALRMLCLGLAVCCFHLHLPLRFVSIRVLVCIATALLYSHLPCTSWVRAVPPVLTLQTALYSFGANPVLTFIFASLASS